MAKLKFPKRMVAGDNVYEAGSVHEFKRPDSVARWIKRGCEEVNEEDEAKKEREAKAKEVKEAKEAKAKEAKEAKEAKAKEVKEAKEEKERLKNLSKKGE